MRIKNVIKHFKKICIHKYWVCKYCWSFGLYWQGIVHDLSKFSPTEFIESVKYYQGDRSPIVACKEANNGISQAWLHHKGRNKHHFEYWFDEGKCLPVPYKYTIEALADYLGAARAYMGKDFTYQKEYEWFKYKIETKGIIMHKSNQDFLEVVLCKAADEGTIFFISKSYLKNLYKIHFNN